MLAFINIFLFRSSRWPSSFFLIFLLLFWWPLSTRGYGTLCERRTDQNLIDIHSHVRWVAADVAGSRSFRDMTVALDRVPHKQFRSIPLCLCLAWPNSLEERWMERREGKDRWVGCTGEDEEMETRKRGRRRGEKSVSVAFMDPRVHFRGEPGLNEFPCNSIATHASRPLPC